MKSRLLSICALSALAFMTAQAQAVVKHAVDDATIIPGPDVDVVGSWNGNASAVAINPNYIVTCAHPGGGVGSTVVFGGTTYKVAQIFNHPTADLRVARIETLASTPANLADYVPVYATPLGVATNFTMGGFGKGRGTDLTTAGGTYAYNWLSEANTTERFGRNIVESAIVGVAGPYTSDLYVADFDGPTSPSYLSGESAIAEFDSGGGWFFEDGPGVWKVGALNAYVDPGHGAFSQFANSANATIPDPDNLYGINLSSYAGFINGIVPEPGSTTLLAIAGGMLAARRRRAHR